MAETLSPWLVAGLLKLSERYKLSLGSSEHRHRPGAAVEEHTKEGGREEPRDQTSIVSDVPFFKGNKVQIIRFHTFDMSGKLPDGTAGGDKDGIWCTIADRRHHVLARIAREAVEWFEA